MLIDFQQALADMVGSPQLCRTVRERPEVLIERYDLSPLEFRRLTAMAKHRGMTSNCVLYRANRLAPLVLNLPDLCRALGSDLTPLLDEYWAACPNTDVNFLVESERFCQILADKARAGFVLNERAREALERERSDLQLRLLASQTVL